MNRVLPTKEGINFDKFFCREELAMDFYNPKCLSVMLQNDISLATKSNASRIIKRIRTPYVSGRSGGVLEQRKLSNLKLSTKRINSRWGENRLYSHSN